MLFPKLLCLLLRGRASQSALGKLVVPQDPPGAKASADLGAVPHQEDLRAAKGEGTSAAEGESTSAAKGESTSAAEGQSPGAAESSSGCGATGQGESESERETASEAQSEASGSVAAASAGAFLVSLMARRVTAVGFPSATFRSVSHGAWRKSQLCFFLHDAHLSAAVTAVGFRARRRLDAPRESALARVGRPVP